MSLGADPVAGEGLQGGSFWGGFFFKPLFPPYAPGMGRGLGFRV